MFTLIQATSTVPVVLVNVSLLDSLVLGSAVLEPNLDLSLGQPEGLCQLEAAAPRDVLGAVELQL